MSKSEKFIVLPFKKVRGQTLPGDMRQASNEAAAERIAARMAGAVVGVAAYSVLVDMESGHMGNPKLLCAYGETTDVIGSN